MTRLDKTKPHWWKNGVFYQIYPKSFQDTTGNGIGDLQGIIQHLDYLEKLGVDGIWLCPICQSPQVDNGYDISDYCSVDAMFGTMEDMQVLIDQGKKRGISVILDLVLNHCSDQHPWFLEAKREKSSPYHDYFIWRDGIPDRFPNDMQSVFGGSAWTYNENLRQYYFHQFTPQQPDLNWENPQLRQALYDSIRFWVDKGVEGFRLDVIDQIAKEPDREITINGPRLHTYFRELSAKAFQEDTLVSVGETWGADVERAKLYSASDGSELSMVFQFQHLSLDSQEGKTKWDTKPLYLPDLKKCFERWQQGLHRVGWNSLFLNNHDLPRIVSRWGNPKEYRVESSKMLATMLYGMEGTPYIYQGEELGMTNIRLQIQQYVDIETQNIYRQRLAQGISEREIMTSIWNRGRDNARTPMQWDSSPNAGFTTGTPWLPVNDNYITVNAEAALADPNSVFYYYQKLIQLRKSYDIFREGMFCLVEPENEKVFAYIRKSQAAKLLTVCNFTGEEVAFAVPEEFAQAQKLIGNYADRNWNLRPYEAYMLYAI